jgi:flagellar biosynthesis protein FliR
MELMISKLIGFVLVLTRVSAFFLVTPIFSGQTIPETIKVSMVFLISIFFSMFSPSVINPAHIDPVLAVMLITNEAIFGFALGLIVILIFSAVQQCGQIIEREMGYTMSEILDPMTGESGQPLSLMIEMIFMLLFLSANGHHLLLLITSRSFEIFPTGSIPAIPILLEGITRAGSEMLVAGLRLTAPMLAAFLVMLVVIGILARIMPDMDILFISMPLRIGLGLMMIGMFLPFINGYITEFADWMDKLLPI